MVCPLAAEAQPADKAQRLADKAQRWALVAMWLSLGGEQLLPTLPKTWEEVVAEEQPGTCPKTGEQVVAEGPFRTCPHSGLLQILQLALLQLAPRAVLPWTRLLAPPPRVLVALLLAQVRAMLRSLYQAEGGTLHPPQTVHSL